MKNYTSISSPFTLQNRRNVVAAIILFILPLVLGGLFFVQQFRSQANVISKPENFFATRVSATAARVEFSTAQQVKATILCAVSLNGVKFFCGEDATATVEHSILTSDAGVNLNTGQGYYVYTNITGNEEPIGYIPADVDDPTFGLSVNVYGDENLGLCTGDEGFDPKLDINQDGCVYTNDMVTLYE